MLFISRTELSRKMRNNHFVPMANKSFLASRHWILTITCEHHSMHSNKMAFCCTGFLSCRFLGLDLSRNIKESKYSIFH